MRSLHSNAGILEQYLRVRAIRETSAFTVKGSHNIGSGSPTLRLYLEEREVDSVSVPQPFVPELPSKAVLDTRRTKTNIVHPTQNY